MASQAFNARFGNVPGLAALDSQRVDGKFIPEDGSIPEGQGILHDLLGECYNLQMELQHASEESDDDGDSEDEYDDEESD